MSVSDDIDILTDKEHEQKNCKCGFHFIKWGKTKDGRQMFRCKNCKTKKVEFKIKRIFVRNEKTINKQREARLKYWASKKPKHRHYVGKFFDFDLYVWEGNKEGRKNMSRWVIK
jgi:hypothetical protein